MWKYTRKLFKKLWKTENVVVMIQFFVIFLREIAMSEWNQFIMMQRCVFTQHVGYKLFGISWQQFDQMPGAAGATYADEHRYVLYALPL